MSRKDTHTSCDLDCDCCDYGQELYLTPFITENQLEEAKEKSRVKLGDGIESYSGFLTVDQKLGSNIFFWFFPAENDPSNAPIILWTQGGPGSSSLIGLFNEHGPYFVDENGNLQQRHKNKWTINHSVIYIDNPVGAGFSYTESIEGFAKNQDDVVINLYEALQQFFHIFSPYLQNDFYLGGQSYAGKYIPNLGVKIHKENQIIQSLKEKGNKFQINFQGILIGSPFTDPFVQLDWGQHLYNFGLIDEYGKVIIDEEMNRMRNFIKEEKWVEAFNVMNKTLLDYPLGIVTHYQKLTGIQNTCNLLQSEYPRHFFHYRLFLQKKSTRRAIHIGKRCLTNFGEGKYTVFNSFAEDFPKSAKSKLEEILENNYRVLLFSCQLDVVVPFMAVEKLIQALDWGGCEEWNKIPRSIWRVQHDKTQILTSNVAQELPNPAGYVKEVKNLTYVFIRNAGHMAMADQGTSCFDMVTRFTRRKSFASPN